MSASKKQTALIILDGWGHSTETENNAVAQAKTPFFDSLMKNFPHTFLQASGEFVGLPDGQVGNSEIGHMTIGAGKTIDTDLVRINKAARGGDFQNNETFQKIFSYIKENNSRIHIIGLIGAGGVHSHEEHLFAFLDLAKVIFEKEGVGGEVFPKIIIHAITDGRDNGPQSSLESFAKLEKKIAETAVAGKNIAEISTVSGRYYPMDRDNNWDRLEKFTDMLYGKNETEIKGSILEEIKKFHDTGKTDEHIEPFIVKNIPLQNNDAVLIFNFRSDRARMLTSKLIEKKSEMDLLISTMTEYSKDFEVNVAFPATKIETTLAAEISKNNLTQVHLAETEKFPHATYFLNGGQEKPHDGEEHVLLESRKDVKTHNEAPEMRAEAIADEAIKRINNGVDFTFINFANPDMVGHTADVPAIITAVETVDRELKKVVDALMTRGGVAIITADHGNAELNIDPVTGDIHTAHTLNVVPCIVTDAKIKLKESGSLQDLAPTVLEILNIEKPVQMTGNSLVVK
jgi:2,3-bisphosphoglycerate-independent phosphoglycerate mutase